MNELVPGPEKLYPPKAYPVINMGGMDVPVFQPGYNNRYYYFHNFFSFFDFISHGNVISPFRYLYKLLICL